MVNRLCQALNHILVSHLDGQLSATIETAGRQVDGTDDCADMVTKEHLGMKFQMFQLVNLDADVFHDSHPSNGFYELFLLELVRGTGHYVDLHPTARSPHQPLDDHRVLVTLILQKDGILCVIDKLRDAVSTVTAAPDQM